MYNFDRELRKIKLRFRNKKITEDQAKYEVRKLHALAKKHHIAWEADKFVSGDPILVETVNQDVKELYELHRQKKLTDQQFLRDNAKILALCEEFKFPFPGSKTIAEGLTVDFVASITEDAAGEEEEDEYADLSFDDVWQDEDYEGEDEGDNEQLQKTYDFANTPLGEIRVEIWVVASEYDVRAWVNGEQTGDLEQALAAAAPQVAQLVVEAQATIPPDTWQYKALTQHLNDFKQMQLEEAGPDTLGEWVYELLTNYEL